jgi:hypothetical protein
LMNNEEDNADGIAFASAADFQDKVYETYWTILFSFIRQWKRITINFLPDFFIVVLQQYTEFVTWF